MDLTTAQKGAIAETKITAAATELGIEVYRPVAEGGRFDLIFAFGSGELMRVQCKGTLERGDVVVVPTVTPPAEPGRESSTGPTALARSMRSPRTAASSIAAISFRCRWPRDTAVYACALRRLGTISIGE